MNKIILGKRFILGAAMCAGSAVAGVAQGSAGPESFFQIVDVPVPEGVELEVGGLALMPNGDLGVATRKGDIYVIGNPTSDQPEFRTFAFGLHEPLGLAYKDGAFYASQRGELTRMVDSDSDGRADLFETVYAWPLSGNYHEYSFGPKVAPDGSFFVTSNVGFSGEEWWRGISSVPWRGWTMKIYPDGEMEPWATGMRSPAGLGMINGEVFYTDNQGDWIGSGGIWHLTKGSFTGHPAGLVWTHKPNSPLNLTQSQVFEQVDERRLRDEKGRYIKPENIADEEDFKTLADVAAVYSEVRLPAVWLPHAVLGVSNSDVVQIPEGVFGPFEGQLLVGDQGQSKLARVVLEEVNGQYQGVAFDFRDGFKSGVLRTAFAEDGSLFVGMTNRGWGSAGPASEGLQRLVYTGEVPFEMKAIRAMADGFEIEFTHPVERESAEDIASYSVRSFTYKYNSVYGSPPVNSEALPIRGVRVSEDGMRVRVVVDGLRRHYVHQMTVEGVRARGEGTSVVHANGYYTLHNIPAGQSLALSELSTLDSSEGRTADVAKTSGDVPTLAEVQPLLAKNTCSACHSADQRVVGPAFAEIAKRGYSDERIVRLIHQPENRNWPDYPTPMPPMAHVPEAEALRIAAWINSLVSEEEQPNPDER